MGGIIVGGGNEPAIPAAQAKRALRILNILSRHVTIMRRFDARVNNLRLFTDFVRPHDGMAISRSKIEWSDHPQIQLLLQRRDRYDELTREMDKYARILEETPAQTPGENTAKFKALDSLAKLRYQQHKELEAMEIAIQDIRKTLAAHLHSCSKFVTDMAKVVQAERLINNKTGTDEHGASNAQIDAMLAEDGE